MTDAQTGQPLQVQIEVKVSKEGYQTEMSSVTITDGPLTVLDVALALGQ